MKKKLIPKAEPKVRKSNVFINGRYRFGLHEQKILLQVLSSVRSDDADFAPCFVSWEDIKSISNGTLNSTAKIDEACQKLKNKTIKIKKGIVEDNFGFLSGWTTHAGKGVYFRIDPGMKSMLLDLLQEGNFTLFRLECAMALSSSYSIRLYEVLKCEQWKSQPVILDLGKLKWSLDIGAADKTYTDFSNFRVHILEKARVDFKKHTDITFTYKTIKEGKRVASLEIIIKKNESYQRTIQGETSKKALEGVKPGQYVIIGGKEYEVMDGGIQYKNGALPTGEINKLVWSGQAKIKEIEK